MCEAGNGTPAALEERGAVLFFFYLKKGGAALLTKPETWPYGPPVCAALRTLAMLATYKKFQVQKPSCYVGFGCPMKKRHISLVASRASELGPITLSSNLPR